MVPPGTRTTPLSGSGVGPFGPRARAGTTASASPGTTT